MARLPWYAFLYRLFGAQGTFWLWVLAIIALWWTARPTWVRLSNRAPVETVSVANVATISPTTDSRRWFRLKGVEVQLDARLLTPKAPDGEPPERLLLDPEDSAAQKWVELRALADAVATAGDGAGRDEARAALVNALAKMEGDPASYLPPPEHTLVIQKGARPARSPPPPVQAGTDFQSFLDYQVELVDARVALIRERVRPGARIEGLLVPTPATLARRLAAEPKVHVSPWLIQEGVKPRDLESYIFGAAAIVLLLLAAGFWGAVRAQNGQPA